MEENEYSILEAVAFEEVKKNESSQINESS
jgi:hypothetical protein